VHLILLQRLPEVPGGQREEMVRLFLEAFSSELMWGAVAVTIAAVTALVPVGLALREAPARAAGAAAGLIWIIAAYVILYGPSLGETELLAVVTAMTP
jgi:hypothetical protein